MKRIITGLAAMTALGVAASTITLDTGSLPSTQGWEYRSTGLHAGAAEADLYSTDGSTLRMDTTGQRAAGIPSNATYRRSDLDENQELTILEWTSRTLEIEGYLNNAVVEFYLGLRVNNRGFAAGLMPDRIAIRDSAGWLYFDIDATKYHTYRMEAYADSMKYDFYIDDVRVASPTLNNSVGENMIQFGDATGWANAKGDMASLTLHQLSFEVGVSDALNDDGCVEATGPDGATVHFFASDPYASLSRTYSWETSLGDTGSGTTFELDLGVDEEATVTLTMADSASSESKTVTREVCVSDTTPPDIIILSPEPGDVCNGNNLGLNVKITDAVDKSIPDYLVTIGNSYVVDLDGETSKVKLFKPDPANGPVPTDVTVATMDAAGNVASETVEIMLQHDKRKK